MLKIFFLIPFLFLDIFIPDFALENCLGLPRRARLNPTLCCFALQNNTRGQVGFNLAFLPCKWTWTKVNLDAGISRANFSIAKSGVISHKENLPVTAESSMLMSFLSKRIIYSKNPHLKLAPASTVKIMTALVVMKYSHPEKRVIVSKFASSMEPSKVNIKDREIYKTEDLLKAVLLNSGNDASVALAESVAGTQMHFVEMMNDMAKELGARDTNFKNSNGLPEQDQYSTAYDLALIMRDAMKHKGIVDFMKMRYSEIEELRSKRCIKLKNHNKRLWKETPYLIVGKTGYTKEAGHCFVGYIHYNRWKRVVVVILKSKNLWKDLELLAESLE